MLCSFVTVHGQEKALTATNQDWHKQIEALNAKIEHLGLSNVENTDIYLDHISSVLMLIGLGITVFVALFGIGAPFIINSSFERSIRRKISRLEQEMIEIKNVKDVIERQTKHIEKVEDEIKAFAKIAKQDSYKAEESAKMAKINMLRSKAIGGYEMDFDERKELLDEAIDLDPKYGETYVSRGNAYYHNMQYGAAIASYSEAIDLYDKLRSDTDIWQLYEQRGHAYYNMGMCDKALEDYIQARRASPKTTAAMMYYHEERAYRKLSEEETDPIKKDEYRRLTEKTREKYGEFIDSRKKTK